ncbi:MAG: FAD-dependent oxidoreductase [Pseudomonadota bacterium]|nr:FAD-dependent oxidoreductase [Pseudomonadota bacterium]
MTIGIVGNGIIGLMAAYAISARQPNVPVAVIGRKSRVGCASLAAAAMFNSFCEIEVGTLSNSIERQRFLFNKQSNSRWPGLLEQLRSESSQLIHGGFGTFLIKNATTDWLEDNNFDAICAALAEFGEPHQEASAADIAHYKPSAAGRATRAIFIPNEGWVNPVHLLSALDSILSRRKNVTFIDDHAHRILTSSGKVTGIALEQGDPVSAEQAIVCNGAEFTALMQRSGLDALFQRVFYGVGATALLECGEHATKNCIRTPNRGLACGLYSAPQTATEVVIGASNFISPVPEKEARLTSVFTLLKSAMEQINADYYRARLLRVNVGWRPTSSDTLPLIGPTSVAGLLIATGTRRDGLHCSPVIADYLTDMILAGTSAQDMRLYAPERPLTRLYSREEAIEKYVTHTINAMYQHGFTPPQGRTLEDIRQHYRNEFSALHEQIGAKDWGIPIDMRDMYKYGHITP